MIYGLIGALIGIIFCGAWCYERQARIYEQISEILTRDRDKARDEAQIYLRLLFPVLARPDTSAGAALPANKPADPGSRTSAAPRPAFLDPRTPFRLRFKSFMKQTNTKQKGRDALAAALPQKPKPVSMKDAAEWAQKQIDEIQGEKHA